MCKSKDCHWLPELEHWLGRRAIITTKKGICKGRLAYSSGWYYCNGPFILKDGEWVPSPYRFIFRKGQFKKIESTPSETSRGI